MVKTVLLQFEEHDRRIFWGVVVFLLLSIAVYVYFLSMSVYAVVARRGAESQASKINSHMSLLESQYVVLDKHIDLTFAHENGFADISVPKYLTIGIENKNFTLRTDHVSE